jgi:hypothetical protein
VWRFGNSREAGDYRIRGNTNAASYIRLSDRLLLGRFEPPTLPQTHSRPSAVFVDELDTGSFQSAANGQVVRRCQRSLVVSYFGTENGVPP